jgi:hypothetical protein
MGYYSGFQYGTGITYGMQTTIESVDPERGPSPGGNNFVITGTGFNPIQWDDTFEAAVLDTMKWSDISSGGTLVTGLNHLLLSTGSSAGSFAGLESTAQWESCQAEIRVKLSAPSTRPLADVCILSFDLWVSSLTYCSVQVLLSADGILRLEIKAYSNGRLINQYPVYTEWTWGVSSFRILRFESDVYFIVNGSVFWKLEGFSAAPASYRISCDNLTAAFALNSLLVESFLYKPYAVFQSQPVVDSQVISGVRMRGTVPPSKDSSSRDAAYSGLVDVSVVSVGTLTLPQAYDYYFVAGLKTINDTQFSVEMSVVNDPQLVTPDGVLKGLGGGY